MKIFFFLLVWFSLFASECKNSVIDSVFYQPLVKDNGVLDLNKSIKKLSSLGVKQLVIQWSKHGSTDFTQQKNFFRNVFQSAQKYKIKVIVGLYADDQYFQKIDDNKVDLKYYLFELEKENISQAKRVWESVKEYDSFGGWYIYDEIDDKHFRSEEKQKILKNYLQNMADDLDEISSKPLYISGFYTMKMDPIDYAEMFSYITQHRFIVMPQSGVGAKLLQNFEAEIYLKEFLDHYKEKFIPIVEVFGGSFEDFLIQLKTIQNATKKQFVGAFSLRYILDKDFLHKYEEKFCK